MVVLRLFDDVMQECAHSILPPEMGLVMTTGGMLSAKKSDGETVDLVVVCGGEFVLKNSNKNEPNQMCMILSQEYPPSTTTILVDGTRHSMSAYGVLNHLRISATSLVIDNGTKLWVAGGIHEQYALSPTELVSLVSQALPANTSGSILQPPIFLTNAAGLELPENFGQHCLQSIGPKMALLVGGKRINTENGNGILRIANRCL